MNLLEWNGRIRIGFSDAAAFLLGAAILFVASTNGAGDFRWRFFLYTFIYVIAAATLVHITLRRDPLGLRGPSLVLIGGLVALTAIGALSLLWSRSVFGGIDKIQLVLVFLLAFFLGRVLLRGVRETRVFMAMVTAAAAALCFYGVMQYLFFFENLVLFLRQHGLDYAISDRVNSRFITPNVFASFLNLAWPMTVALLLTEGRKALRWLWGAALALELTCLYLTQSRGGWVVFALLTMAMALLVPRELWKGRLAMAAAALVLAVVACVACSFYSPLGEEQYAAADGSASGAEYSGLDVTAAAGSMRGRVGIWRGGLNMFGDNIMGGVGLGGFGIAMQRYQHRAFFSVHAHDYLLETAAELGIAGLAIALLLTALVLSRARRVIAVRKAGPAGVFVLSLWALCAGFLLHNLIDISWFNPLCATVFWVSAGALFSLVEGEDSRAKGQWSWQGADVASMKEGRGMRRSALPALGAEKGDDRPDIASSHEHGAGEADGMARQGRAGDSGRNEARIDRQIRRYLLALWVVIPALVVTAAYFNARLFLSASARDRADEADTVGEERLAVEEYGNALRFWEADPGTHQQLGYVLQSILAYGWGEEGHESEYAEGSLYHLDRAIELEPDNAYSYLWKGTLLLNLDRHEEGRLVLRKAEELYPNNPAPPFFEGESFFAQGDQDAALGSFSRAIRLTPYYADVNIVPFRGRPEFRFIISAVGRSLEIYLSQGRAQDALSLVDEALRWLPDNPTLHFYRAYVLSRSGDAAGALSELDRVEEILPGCAGVHLMKGTIYQETGDLDAAREEFLRELEIDPNSVEAREWLDALEKEGSPGQGG